MSIAPDCYSGLLVKNTPSFRKGLGVGYICCFLRFSSLLPLLYLALFRREKSGRWPRERRHNSLWQKSSFVMILPKILFSSRRYFAVLLYCALRAQIWARDPHFLCSLHWMVFGYRSVPLSVLLCGSLRKIFLAVTLYTRKSLASTPYTLHPTPETHHKSVKNIVFTLFPCSVRNFFVSLRTI